MAKYLVLPKIGMNMEEALISEWFVKPGDRVEKDQVILQAETDKAMQDIQATDSGVIRELLVQEGDIVPCQEKIALLEGEEEEVPAVLDELEATEPADAKKKLKISPLARKTAAELGISLEELSPAQPGHRIVKEDVERCAESRRPVQAEFQPFSPRRNTVANRMRESVQTKPRVGLKTTIDCEELWAWRTRLCQKKKIGFNELIAKACAAALQRHPEMNLVAAAEGYCLKDSMNIGIAVDTPSGLLVPVLHSVEKKGVFDLSDEFAALVERAREGKATAEDMTGGTFTISNLGMYGVESFDPIINPPECLILGVGCIREVPAVIEHTLCVRRQMEISLCFDHAVFDGAAAAKLLRDIKEMLEMPAMMLA